MLPDIFNMPVELMTLEEMLTMTNSSNNPSLPIKKRPLPISAEESPQKKQRLEVNSIKTQLAPLNHA